MGVGTDVEAIASSFLTKYSLNNRADRINMVREYQKVEYETEV